MSCGGADYPKFSLVLDATCGLMTCFLMFYVKLGVSRKTSMPVYGANAGFGGRLLAIAVFSVSGKVRG